MPFRSGLAILACVLLASAPAMGQSAFLVKDINTTTYDSPPVPYGTFRDLRAVGGKLYFVSESLEDLWVSDGTTYGTELLRDLCPEDCFSGEMAGSLGNLLLWSTTSNGTQQLWRTDGTRPGTFPLTGEDQSAFGYNSRSEPKWAVFHDALYFSSCSAPDDCDLWKTDGTVGGTRRHHQAEGSPGWVVADAGRLFYLSRDAEQAADLWVTDGTEAGTVFLRHFEPGEYTRSPVLAGGRLFFVATTDGDEVWTSDGTPGGTRALTQFAGQRPFSHGEWLEPKGSRVYFVADDDTHGNELWRTDGTPAGTVRVTELVNENPFGSESASFFTEIGGTVVLKAWDGAAMRLFTVKGTPASTAPLPLACDDCDLGASRLGLFSSGSGSGSRAFFVLRESYMEQLWVTDGTAAGTFKLKDLCSFCGFSGLRPWQSGVLVAVGGELWFSDGTVAGTRPLTDLGALRPREDPLEVAEIGGKLYLLATDGNVDSLWVADGPGGTRPVVYYPATAPTSDPGHLVAYGDRLFFKAWNRQGTDLWWTSGTPESTGSFNEAVPVSWYESSEIVPAAGVLFFQVGETYESFDLWRTDGTAPGTFPLVHMPGESVLVPYQGKLYFFNGREIWKSDGTLQGTVKSGDLPADLVSVEEAVPGPNGIYLNTVTAPYKTDFWFTDGTSAGTRQITDFNLGGVGGGIPEFTRLGSYMYFSWDGRLWRTDGTRAGTAPLSLPVPLATISHLTAHQGLLYFLASDTLWRTDGTAAGTVLLRTLSYQNTTRYPIELQPFDGKVFFNSTDDVHGVELWETNGTPEGTRMVSDLYPGPDSSTPQHLTEGGGRLFFSAWDDRHGVELWQSDGTGPGTRLVQDIAPGVASSRPDQLTVAGNHLYFTADDRLTGRELWAVPLAAASGCKPAPTRLCLNGGRYAVEAAWRDFQGNQGSGHAVSLTSDTGYFWFFDEKNVEVVLKVLDGRGVNGHVWVFYGALSTVQYTLTVTDTQTGISRRYVNPTGQLASVGDTRSFGPLGAASRTGGSPALPPVVKSKIAAAGVCEPSPTRLCLNGDRFAVEATWKDFQGNSGVGKAVELTPDTGYFWFFNQENVEVVLKVLNGLPVNGYHWVFYGALSSVEYTLTVTDTVTGATNTYKNPSGSMSSRADTGAFIE